MKNRKCILSAAAACLLAAAGTATADPQLMDGLHEVTSYNHAHYDMRTGVWTFDDRPPQTRETFCWENLDSSGFFWGMQQSWDIWAYKDWGATGDCGTIDTFQFVYATNILDGCDISTQICIYDGKLGSGDPNWDPNLVTCFFLDGLPGAADPVPGSGAGWIVTVTLTEPLTFTTGNFAFEFSWCVEVDPICDPTGENLIGPSISAIPDPNLAPGAEDIFDLYESFGGDCPHDPNDVSVRHQVAGGLHAGTFWFGGDPWASFRWAMGDKGDPPSDCRLDQPCPPDVNDDGVVDSDDLFDFLGAWSAGDPNDPVADYNCDGVVDSDDLFDFLGDFSDPGQFPGC